MGSPRFRSHDIDVLGHMGLGIQVNLGSEVKELESQVSCDQLDGVLGHLRPGVMGLRTHQLKLEIIGLRSYVN